jgi:two-component system OmpR family sensor kinase
LPSTALKVRSACGGVVDVEARLQDGRPMPRVVDDGPGISPAERERVFDRFHRGANAKLRSAHAGGSGRATAIAIAIALAPLPNDTGQRSRCMVTRRGQASRCAWPSTP